MKLTSVLRLRRPAVLMLTAAFMVVVGVRQPSQKTQVAQACAQRDCHHLSLPCEQKAQRRHTRLPFRQPRVSTSRSPWAARRILARSVRYPTPPGSRSSNLSVTVGASGVKAGDTVLLSGVAAWDRSP